MNIQSWIPFAIVVAGALITWGAAQMQILSNRKNIEDTANRMERRFDELNQTKVDKALLNEMIKRIDGNITEIKAMLKRMEGL